MVSTETEGAFSDQSHGASYVCTQGSVSELPLMEQTSESIGYGKYFVVVSYNLMVGSNKQDVRSHKIPPRSKQVLYYSVMKPVRMQAR